MEDPLLTGSSVFTAGELLSTAALVVSVALFVSFADAVRVAQVDISEFWTVLLWGP